MSDTDEVAPDREVAPADGGLAASDAADSATDAIEAADPLSLSLANTMPPYALEDAHVFLRFDLRRTEAGDLEVDAVTRVSALVRPLPSLRPDYVLVARAGERIVDAISLSFPEQALGLAATADGAPSARAHDVVSLSDSTTSVFVEFDSAIDDVRLILPDDTLALQVDSHLLTAALDPQPVGAAPSSPAPRSQADAGVESSPQPLLGPDLKARYPHLAILASGQESRLPRSLLRGAMIVDPTQDMNDAIAEALDTAAPALRSSVQTIAWVKWPDGSTLDRSQYAYTAGSQVIVNASLVNDPELVPALVHELAHSFTYLSNSVAADNKANLALWPESVRSVATDLNARYHLVQGLQQTWAELHYSGLKAGLASDYRGSEWEGISDVDATFVGFATAYGSKAPDEDLAEYVSTTTLPSKAFPGVCPLFERDPHVTPENSIPYAKLTLLRSVGAIDAHSFDRCVYGAVIVTEEGFNFPGVATFSHNSFARVELIHDLPVFDILAEGPANYTILIQIDLKSKSDSVLGLHRFDSDGVFGDDETGLILVNHDDGAYNRWAKTGLVLITENSKDRTQGVVFGLVLANVLGLETDSFPLTPFQISGS